MAAPGARPRRLLLLAACLAAAEALVAPRAQKASRALYGELRNGGKMNINDADMSGADGSKRMEAARRKIERIKKIKRRGEDATQAPPAPTEQASAERMKELRKKAEQYQRQSGKVAAPTAGKVQVEATVLGGGQGGKAAATVVVKVPEGFAAGDTFGWIGAKGETLEVPVPQDCGPGDALEVRYQPRAPRPAPGTGGKTSALLAEYRASLGCDLEEVEANRATLDEAMQRYRRLSFRGEYRDAVKELEGVRQWMAMNTEEGCLLLLELAMAYETADDRALAGELYGQLLKSIFPDIRSNARMLLGRLHAVEALGMGDSGKEMAKVAQFSLNATALAAAANLNRRGKAMDFVRPMAPDPSLREPEAAEDLDAAVAILRDACEAGVAKPSVASLRRGPAPAARASAADAKKEVAPEDALRAVWRLQIEAEKRWVGTDAEFAGATEPTAARPERRDLELRLDGEWTPRFRIRLGEAVPAMAVMRVAEADQAPAALVFDAGTKSVEGTLSAGPFRAASKGSYSCDTSFGRDILRMDLPGKLLLPGAVTRMRVLHVSGSQGVLVVSTEGLVEVWRRERRGLEGDLLRLPLAQDEIVVRRWLYAWADASFADPASAASRRSLSSKVDVQDAEDGVRILFQPSSFADRDRDNDADAEAEIRGGGREARSGARDGTEGEDATMEGGLRLSYDGDAIRIARCNYGPKAVVKEMSEKAILSALQDAVGERFAA